MADLYPVMLDLEGKRVVIVGGGNVALRKARGLLEAGASVVCIAPDIHPDMPQAVKLLRKSFEPNDLKDAFLVFAVTNSRQVNDLVVQEARQRDLLVSRSDASDAWDGDFVRPAVARSGVVTLAVSADGAPTVALAIRDQLQQHMDNRLIQLAADMKTIRPAILSKVQDGNLRADIFRALVRPDALAAYAAGGASGLLAWVQQAFKLP